MLKVAASTTADGRRRQMKERTMTKRGFGTMDPDKQREIASKGGKAAHAKGVAHEFTREKAKEAGRIGGKRISANREHMAAIGRLGAQARRTKKGDETSASSAE